MSDVFTHYKAARRVQWNRFNARRVSLPAGQAVDAMRTARAAVAAGKSSYASTFMPERDYASPQSSKRGHVHLSNPEAFGFRLVGRVIPEPDSRNGFWDKRGDTGWHTDPHGDVFKDGTGLCYGVVYQLPGRGGKARLVTGFEFGGYDGGPTLDLSDIREFDMSEWSGSLQDFYPATETARRADNLAKHMAEAERDYQTAWTLGNRYAETRDTIAAERKSALALFAEMRPLRKAGATSPAICAALRSTILGHVRSIARARKLMLKLASGDGGEISFWTGDSRLREAFNESAGEPVFAVKAEG